MRKYYLMISYPANRSTPKRYALSYPWYLSLAIIFFYYRAIYHYLISLVDLLSHIIVYDVCHISWAVVNYLLLQILNIIVLLVKHSIVLVITSKFIKHIYLISSSFYIVIFRIFAPSSSFLNIGTCVGEVKYIDKRIRSYSRINQLLLTISLR